MALEFREGGWYFDGAIGILMFVGTVRITPSILVGFHRGLVYVHVIARHISLKSAIGGD